MRVAEACNHDMTEFHTALAFEAFGARIGVQAAESIAPGVLPQLPGGEGHGRYFLDAAGEIQNTVLLDSEKERALRALNSEMRRFEQEHGRYAASLEEWSEWSKGLIPEHPYDGESWAYDPATGEVR